uniref:Uncharacterized protein n=1 Tax=viral metagenome TaxID=1070528 RepID=A0A6C0EAG8_9ZZZZ
MTIKLFPVESKPLTLLPTNIGIMKVKYIRDIYFILPENNEKIREPQNKKQKLC